MLHENTSFRRFPGRKPAFFICICKPLLKLGSRISGERAVIRPAPGSGDDRLSRSVAVLKSGLLFQ